MKTRLHFIVTFLIFFTFISILMAQTLPSTVVMTHIDGGIFKLGSNSVTGHPDQKVAAPEPEVTLSMYSMRETGITNRNMYFFLNIAFNEGLIEIVEGMGEPSAIKRLIKGTAS